MGKTIRGLVGGCPPHLYSIGRTWTRSLFKTADSSVSVFKRKLPSSRALTDVSWSPRLPGCGQSISIFPICPLYSFRLSNDMAYFGAQVYKLAFRRWEPWLFRQTLGKSNQSFCDGRGVKMSVQTCPFILLLCFLTLGAQEALKILWFSRSWSPYPLSEHFPSPFIPGMVYQQTGIIGQHKK